jgi:hypothetical protein
MFDRIRIDNYGDWAISYASLLDIRKDKMTRDQHSYVSHSDRLKFPSRVKFLIGYSRGLILKQFFFIKGKEAQNLRNNRKRKIWRLSKALSRLRIFWRREEFIWYWRSKILGISSIWTGSFVRRSQWSISISESTRSSGSKKRESTSRMKRVTGVMKRWNAEALKLDPPNDFIEETRHLDQ